MSALHNAIEAINNGAEYIKVGNCTIDSPLPPLIGLPVPDTQESNTAFLDLSGATIRVTSGMNDGWLFRFQRTAQPGFKGSEIDVHGGKVVFESAPKGLVFFESGADNNVRFMRARNCGTVAKWGGDEIAHRCHIEQIQAQYAGTGHVLHFAHCANASYDTVHVNGAGRNISLIAFVPPPGGFIDTVVGCHHKMQSWVRGNRGSGAKYGIYTNTLNGKVVNVWLHHGYTDHTTVASYLWSVPTGNQVPKGRANDHIVKNFLIDGMPRADADNGVNVRVSRHASSHVRLRHVVINDPSFISPNTDWKSVPNHPEIDLTIRKPRHEVSTAA